LATSRRVQIEKFVKKVRESTLTLVKDAFYTTTDFEDPCPVKMVLEAYGKMGEKTSVGYKQTVKDLEELPIIPLLYHLLPHLRPLLQPLIYRSVTITSE
jgi:hypothetical protein